MHGIALMLAATSLAVDYSWQKTDSGQVEYLIRVEPEVLPALIGGEEIHSDVPAEAGAAQRFRLRIGIDGQAAAATSRRASAGRFGAPSESATVLTQGSAAPAETQAVSFGWQPGVDGGMQYYVQIDPALLRTLAAGDEIEAPVDAAAGHVATFVVFGGNKQLPRVGASNSPSATTTPNSNTTAATTPQQSRFGAGNTTSPAAEPEQSRFGSTATPPSDDVGTSRFGAGGSGSAPATTPPASSSRFGDAADQPASTPPPFPNPDDSGRRPSTYTPSPATSNNQYPPSRTPGNSRTPAPLADYDRAYADNSSMQPPPAAASPRPLPPLNEPANSGARQTGYQAPSEDNRVALADNQTTRGTGTQANAPPTGPAAETPEAAKPWWPFVLTACALFLSIGGNVYLGWTAVEFHSRYRLAVERLRSASGRT